MYELSLREIAVAVFIIMPFITLIHEIGHACIAKLFGCRLKRIVLGKGKRLLKLGFLEINTFYFYSGFFEHDYMPDARNGRIMVLLGGSIFNLISAIMALILFASNYAVGINWALRIFISFSIYIIISALLPISYGGCNSDGKQIYQTIKYGHSKFRLAEEDFS